MSEENTFFIRSRAIIIHDGKLLVVKHTNEGDRHDEFYTLPGGHLDFGETALECMSRELVEELGVEPHIGRLLYVNTYIEKEQTQPMEFFFEITNGEDYINIDHLDRSHAYEIAEIRWVGKDEDIHFLPKELFDDFKNGTILSDEARYIKS